VPAVTSEGAAFRSRLVTHRINTGRIRLDALPKTDKVRGRLFPMTSNVRDPRSKRDEFKRETPSTYRWAMGASGLVAVATATTLTLKPETAGYAITGLILFILLIFIVINLEVGTTPQSNPLAQNAQLQVKVLSWFATIAFIVGAIAIMSSMLLRWPLDITFYEDKTTQKYLGSITRYDLPRTTIERAGMGKWQEKSHRDNSILHSFTEDNFTAQFLYLTDGQRNLKLRVPTQGGMLEWSVNDVFRNCDLEYCWGDVDQATMFR